MTQVGSVYGQALYDLAKSEGLTDTIRSQLDVLEEGISPAPEFLRLLSSPNISKEERCALLDTGFRDKLHPYVLNFLKILTEKGYAKFFPDCCASYRDHYNEDHGILPVKAFTAAPLKSDQAQRLSRKLSGLTGKQIALKNVVDTTILGGVRLDYDGKRLDDTLRGRLNALREKLKSTVL